MSTHDQSEALTMSNRIAVFNDGVILQLASPSALYEQPENAFVAQFIGENNRLCGRVKSVEGQHCHVDLDGGGTIRALNVRVEGMGARTTLSLRPGTRHHRVPGWGKWKTGSSVASRS